MHELADVCEGNRLHYELTRELLSLTLQQRSSGRRAKLNEKLEKAFSRHFYEDVDDALARAREMVDAFKKKAERQTASPHAEGQAATELQR
jgi:DNA sulfur modification protein DndC